MDYESLLGDAPTFVSGWGNHHGMYGANPQAAMLGLLAGSMSDISGAEFVSGGDPVSALLGLSQDIAGLSWGDVTRTLNPLNVLDPRGNSILNPFHALATVARATGLMKKQQAQADLTKAAINQKLIQNGAGVLDRAPTKARRYPCGLTPTVVAGGASATIRANPQQLYRPERFIVPGSIAPNFSLTDIKVGNVSQLPNNGEIPCEIFAQNGVDAYLELDTVNPAIDLLVVVTNLTGGNLTFRGAFIGTSVQ
jgi:hypothetical protein